VIDEPTSHRSRAKARRPDSRPTVPVSPPCSDSPTRPVSNTATPASASRRSCPLHQHRTHLRHVRGEVAEERRARRYRQRHHRAHHQARGAGGGDQDRGHRRGIDEVPPEIRRANSSPESSVWNMSSSTTSTPPRAKPTRTAPAGSSPELWPEHWTNAANRRQVGPHHDLHQNVQVMTTHGSGLLPPAAR
jgi:hypothetical protein